MSETEDYEKTATPSAHKASHQDGGSDEISAEGLAGELTAEQKSAWAKVSGKPTTFTPEAHKASHEAGGADALTAVVRSVITDFFGAPFWASIPDKPSTFTPAAHKSTHENGGADEVSVAGLSGSLADPQTPAAHKTSHQDGGSDEISIEGLAGTPALATATPTASKIPIADANGKLDGWITDKPKFLADKNGTSQTGIPLDTGTKVTFTNEVFDVGAGYDAANSKWIPGVIGNYRINCNLYLDTKGAGKYVAIGVFKNGVNIQQSYDEDVFAASISRSVAVTDAADYFEIYVYQNAIANNSINGGTHLTGFSGYMLP